MIAITGNTYPVKNQLKALGARWNPDQKAWMVREELAAAARQIVAGAGSKKAHSNGGNYDPQRFNGYGRARGGYVKQCKTGGNCSSFGSGRSCGAPDCDGY